MTIRRLEGPDTNRQYFEITRVYTGKKNIVSVDKNNADRYEQLRNKYEAQYIDENTGIRSFVSKQETKLSIAGLTIGAASGLALGTYWKASKAYKAFSVLVMSIAGLVIGSGIGEHNMFHLDRKIDILDRNEKNITLK